MILDKEVEIIGNAKIIKFYKDLGYNIMVGKAIKVKTEDLSKGSHVCVKVRCDVCSKEKLLIYQKYIKNIEGSLSGKYCCSVKCGLEKRKKTNLQKYGYEFAQKNPDVYNKTKQTNIKKYGFENVFQNKYIKEKSKKTMLKNYGVEYSMQNKELKEKSQRTCEEKYGTYNISQNEKIKKKKEETCSKNHGVKHPSQNKEIKEKTKKTNLDKYGFEYVSQNKTIKNKTRETNIQLYGTNNFINSNSAKHTMFKKYGVEHPMQDPGIHEKAQISGKKLKLHEKSGLKYRGTYEEHFLDYCFKNNIKLEKATSIKYEFKGKRKAYHPDFYYKEKNLIIEIKSSYYYNLELEKNLAKQKACLDQGYNFIFIIDFNYKDFKLNFLSHLLNQ